MVSAPGIDSRYQMKGEADVTSACEKVTYIPNNGLLGALRLPLAASGSQNL